MTNVQWFIHMWASYVPKNSLINYEVYLGETFLFLGTAGYDFTGAKEAILFCYVSCYSHHMCYLVSICSHRQVYYTIHTSGNGWFQPRCRPFSRSKDSKHLCFCRQSTVTFFYVSPVFGQGFPHTHTINVAHLATRTFNVFSSDMVWAENSTHYLLNA